MASWYHGAGDYNFLQAWKSSWLQNHKAEAYSRYAMRMFPGRIRRGGWLEGSPRRTVSEYPLAERRARVDSFVLFTAPWKVEVSAVSSSEVFRSITSFAFEDANWGSERLSCVHASVKHVIESVVIYSASALNPVMFHMQIHLLRFPSVKHGVNCFIYNYGFELTKLK